MSDIKNIELIDDIRKDALLLMKQDDKLDYIEASKRAREELIGKQNVTSAEMPPFSVNIDENLIKEK